MPDKPSKTRQQNRNTFQRDARANAQAQVPGLNAENGLAPYQSSPGFLNPGPKAALLLLVLIIMAGYTGLVHGLIPQSQVPPGIAALPPQGGDAGSATQGPREAGSGATAQTGQSEQPAQGSEQGGSGQAGGEHATGQGVDQGPAAEDPEQAAQAAHREKLTRFANNPRLLNNKEWAGEDLSGLILQRSTVTGASFSSLPLEKAHFYSMTFRNCNFKEVDFSEVDFREILFENCTFEDSNFDGARLFMTVFKDCGFISTGRERGLAKARFALASLAKVSFENVSQEGLLFYQVGGNLTFKDSDLSGIRLHAYANQQYLNERNAPRQLIIAMDNCTGGEFEFEVQGMDSQLKIDKSEFDGGKISGFNQIQVTASSLRQDAYLSAEEWLVARDSKLCATLTAQEALYLINNTYAKERSNKTENSFLKGEEAVQRVTKVRPYGGALGIIDGGTAGAWLSTNGGQLWISNLQIDFVYFELDQSRGDSTLNLKNVGIKSGHIWNSRLKGGYWENVTINKTMSSRNSTYEEVKRILTSNVTLPEEGPWIEGDKFELVPTPRKDWVRYQVPQLRYR